MPYRLKLSQETDPIRILKRRTTNRLKQLNWQQNNVEKVKEKRKRYKLIRDKKIQDLVLSFKEKCSRCDFDKHPCALDFHHIDPSNKSFGISSLKSRARSKLKILAEIKKCILLCANCHRIEEYGHL